MSPRTVRERRAQRNLAAVFAFAMLLGLCVAVARPVTAGAEAAAGRLVAEPVLKATAAGVRQLFGPSPLEAPGEVWGVGEAAGERSHIVRYTEAGGWEAVPDPIEASGATVPLPELAIPRTAAAGRTTPAGGVVTLAALGPGGAPPEDLIVRDPGGPFRAVPPPAEPLLLKNEQLFRNGAGSNIRIAAVEEPDGHTGAFVVPDAGNQLNTGVLHYDGVEWTREPICLAAAPECEVPAGFAVLAIEAAGPGEEWMLARQLGQREGIVLLKREAGVWQKQTLGPPGTLGAIFAQQTPVVSGVKATIGAREKGQALTVTSNAVWVDATIGIGEKKTDATIYYNVEKGEVTGSWCDLPTSTPEPGRNEICRFPLGSSLSRGEGRSFAWPGGGAEGEFGTRAITGVGQGAMLIFENGSFSRIPLSGSGGGSAGAALTAPDQGWLGPSFRLTREPVPSGLQQWPVPFRRPLLAVAPQPGVPVGELSSQALAVGVDGQVARYLPGVGWQPESLLTGSGSRATPTLRGVAWPTSNFAYAVGDEGAMWLWRGSTGLWEPDPGAPPNLIRGNFTGVAFDPSEPEWGYAVGKQGLLLRYGKRWSQEPIPTGLNPEINITSIAFAGNEALATWTLAVPSKFGEPGDKPEYIGGLIVNDGSGWRIEEGAGAALSQVESGLAGFAPRRVAGLPDGGAVIAGLRGAVIEREAAGAPWHPVPGPLVGYPAAVAAVREGGQLRALLSVGQSPLEENSDRAQALGQPPEGQAPLLTEPYPLPESGFVIRQTANGWQDEERQDYPPPETLENLRSEGGRDIPREPDAALAILVNPEGSQGWIVGGQTGERATKESGPYLAEGLQTASVIRYGPGAAPPPNTAAVSIPIAPEDATFAVGGGAECAASCADLVGTGIGPDVWLRAAVARAASISGLRAFLYTGGGVSANLDPTKVTPEEFGEEENAYAQRLGSEAGALPVFAAPSQADIYESSLAIFGAKFAGFPAPLGIAPGAGIATVDPGERSNGNYSYSFDSYGASGQSPVRVIVLDTSTTPLSVPKQCWLATQLARAKAEVRPAIVLGTRAVGTEAVLQQLLVSGTDAACPQPSPAGASAYFYEAEANTTSRLSFGGMSIPAFGTGSLGYLPIPNPVAQGYVPTSGFLLASVEVAKLSPVTNVAPVTARLIPNIGSLAIDARDGTLLRRSQPALFEALARRPVAGIRCSGIGFCVPAPDPYTQIPTRCLAGSSFNGQSCAAEIQPEYDFTSSRPDIANFVKVDPNSSNPRAVFLDGSGKPVPDPTSGLLCAFNSGTTVVSVVTGGLSYSVPVTVQAGSVARPCGTVPRTDLPAAEPAVAPPPPPPAAQPPFKAPPGALPPPPAPAPPVVPTPVPAPPPIPVAHHVPVKPPAPLQLPFFAPAPVLSPIVVIVPPPPPPAVEPTPPSGTSPVTQPAVSPQPEKEEEAAFDLVHHAVAYLPGDRRPPAFQAAAGSSRHGLPNALLPGLLILAAVAFAGVAGPRLRRSPEPAFHRNRPQRRPFDEHP